MKEIVLSDAGKLVMKWVVWLCCWFIIGAAIGWTLTAVM